MSADPNSSLTAQSLSAQPAAPSRRTLGPVQDLERHLPAEWWRGLFNSLYLKTDGDVVEDAAATAREIDLLIDAAGLEPGQRILDLCCGQGRHLMELGRRGFTQLTGVDRSRYLVRLARRRAAAAGLAITLREGDARRFRLPETGYDRVMLLGNSFGYFEQADDDRVVLDRVLAALAPGGSLAMELTDGRWLAENFEPRSWEWIDGDHLVCRERTLSAVRDRLICREVVVHAERGVIADQFYAERLYTPEAIAALLRDAGFARVRHHGAVEATSERGDLGMMARRLVLTADAPRRPAAPAGTVPAVREVTVLMGDPRLPDSVKLEGAFNQEDLDTIQKLKDALGELKGYSFTFKNDHSKLISDLQSDPPEFVFNLCDEGFENDALKELHVPALLEILNVPYTGGPPACLAVCYDKATVRAVAEDLDVPVPAQTILEYDDQAAHLPSTFPALLKPARGDGSIGITAGSVVNTPDEILVAADRIRREWPGRAILVQEFLTGPEYTVGVIGNPGVGVTVLPVLEVDYSDLPEGLPKILGYESKWDPESPYWTDLKFREAELPEPVRRAMVDHTLKLFSRLDCRDYARMDFRCGADGVPRLLEVNPNPGWVWDGKFNLQASLAGYDYADLLRMILEAAFDRLEADFEKGSAPRSSPSS
ncbi:methyltransferase domain-containing protein [Alienimonas chondri]|uniref:D-alanine--D-alanine ligase n=1 Tax=Alienimonas chondri TaxID=2681879 RepID=A0ABX1VA07_9PLAN|nr:methyltransferase domain-containing protein [Alienimonas chondri]NNJ24925.1 D-alanine--D-alanine ligase [Alienimonas chondri]